LPEVGAALGLEERAAQKRVMRAVEKLRKIFIKQGKTLTATAIAGAVSANSVQAAPVGLVKIISAVAVAKGAAATVSTLTIVKGALKIMAWTKMKTVIVAGVIVLLAAGTTTITVKEIQEHRTYPWQIANPGSPEGIKVLDSTLPQVEIVRSKFNPNQSYGSLMDDIRPQNQWRYLGTHATPSEIIIRAYQNGFPLMASQIILPSNVPDGFYDYIANLTNGSQQALQALIKNKFGLVGSYEMRDSDVLLLKVAQPNAAGLKLTTQSEKPQGSGIITGGLIHEKNVPMSRLAFDLGWDLGIPVINHTGLTGSYDFNFPDDFRATFTGRNEKVRQWLHDELGLELVPTNMPIEMLVIERAP
jgi:uncharacterized protein (TIGR03435 family)